MENSKERNEKRKILASWWESLTNDFDLEPNSLNDQTILDLGASDRRFAASALLNGSRAKITSIDPTYSSEGRGKLKQSLNLDAEPEDFRPEVDSLLTKQEKKILDERTLAGFANNLPLPNDSFDLVILSRIPLEPEDVESSLKEIFRVLKPAGEVRLYPVVYLNGKLENEKRVLKIRQFTHAHNLLVKEKTILEADLGQDPAHPNEPPPKIREDLLILKIKLTGYH